ncbi:MAG: hypothetical protein AB7R90_19485 [Reyranellaceae bacterium]
MIYADRVKFVTASTGTGAVQEGSAVAPFRQLSAVTGAGGRQFVYLIQNAGATEYEWGIGTYTAGTPGSLSRDTVFGSSNSGALVNFSAGTKTVSVIDAAAFHGVLDGEMHGGVTGGTSTALTANFYPQPFELRDFARVAIKLHTDIGAAATFNPNGLGAEPIMEQAASGLQAVTAGRFKSGMILVLRRWNSQWQIANGMVQDVVPDADETTRGIAERATLAEALAGSDSTRFITPLHLAAATGKKGSNLADGASVTIPLTGGTYFILDGTTSLTTVALEGGNSARQPGFRVLLGFAAAKTIVHSASLDLVDNADLDVAPGDLLELVYDGAGAWKESGFHLETIVPDPGGLPDVQVSTVTSELALTNSMADSGLAVTLTTTDANDVVDLAGLVPWGLGGFVDSDPGVGWQILRDATNITGAQFQQTGGVIKAGQMRPCWADVPGAPGTYVYKVQVRKDNGSSQTIEAFSNGGSAVSGYLRGAIMRPA